PTKPGTIACLAGSQRQLQHAKVVGTAYQPLAATCIFIAGVAAVFNLIVADTQLKRALGILDGGCQATVVGITFARRFELLLPIRSERIPQAKLPPGQSG